MRKTQKILTYILASIDSCWKIFSKIKQVSQAPRIYVIYLPSELAAPKVNISLVSQVLAVELVLVKNIVCVNCVITCIQGYHAPLDVYHQLNEINEDPGNHELHKMSKINLCVGKEWYRFPSNFFLPERLVLLS